jgi:hypothetical protein
VKPERTVPVKEATRIPRVIPAEAEVRLRRLRRVAWILDRCVGIGGKARFGIDPLIGLIPVAGDWVAAVLSLYVIYESLRLGMPWPVLGRMLANVGIEALVGTVPVVGDIFDFIWQANTRNLRLVEQHYHARLKPRSSRAIAGFFAAVVVFVIGSAIATLWLTVWLLKQVVAML